MTTPKKYYEVSYTKKVGGTNTMVVIGRNESEVLANAKNIRVTGKDFKVVKEVPKQASAKGSGVAMGK